MIPKDIYQSWYTKDFDLDTQHRIQNMKSFNPNWNHHIYDDDDIDKFVNDNFPGIIADSYNRLNIIVAKVDFWRYLVLYKNGGVYLDIDSCINGSLDELIHENDKGIITCEKNKDLYVQWGLIFDKNHIILKTTIDLIIHNIRNNAFPNNIHKMTGPTVYSHAINIVYQNMFNKPLIHRDILESTDITFKKNDISFRIYGVDYNSYFTFKDTSSKSLYVKKQHWRQEQKEKNLLKYDESSAGLDVSRPFYCALRYHFYDAYEEANIVLNYRVGDAPEIATFARKYYNSIQKLSQEKSIDYCFIGSIKSCFRRRKWVLQFVKDHFTKNSLYINTDYKRDEPYSKLGEFDLSDKELGYNPKRDNDGNPYSRKVQYREVEENLFYFQSMCNSKFVLCPGGDAPWSFRFYETLMCKSIPIVETRHHTYRTLSEYKIDYKYILYSNHSINDFDMNIINHNTKIFETNHLLS